MHKNSKLSQQLSSDAILLRNHRKRPSLVFLSQELTGTPRCPGIHQSRPSGLLHLFLSPSLLLAFQIALHWASSCSIDRLFLITAHSSRIILVFMVSSIHRLPQIALLLTSWLSQDVCSSNTLLHPHRPVQRLPKAVNRSPVAHWLP